MLGFNPFPQPPSLLVHQVASNYAQGDIMNELRIFFVQCFLLYFVTQVLVDDLSPYTKA